MELYFFYLFKILVIISAVLVVSVRNPVHSVLLLVSVFTNISGLLLLLKVEFLAFVFLVVYVGAIAVLFLFVVMMLNIRSNTTTTSFFSLFNFLTAFGVAYFFSLNYFPGYITLFISYNPFTPLNIDNYTNLAIIGNYLFTLGWFPFIMSSFILFVAMCGAILLTLSHSQGIRRQEIANQNTRSVTSAIRLIR